VGELDGERWLAVEAALSLALDVAAALALPVPVEAGLTAPAEKLPVAGMRDCVGVSVALAEAATAPEPLAATETVCDAVLVSVATADTGTEPVMVREYVRVAEKDGVKEALREVEGVLDSVLGVTVADGVLDGVNAAGVAVDDGDGPTHTAERAQK
jgi:hypothetical protein